MPAPAKEKTPVHPLARAVAAPVSNYDQKAPKVHPLAARSVLPEAPRVVRAEVAKADKPPGIGHGVFFVLDSGPNAGQVRPALVVNVIEGVPNLQVFTDGDGNKHGDHLGAMEHRANVPHGSSPGCWHYEEKAEGQEKAEGSRLKAEGQK